MNRKTLLQRKLHIENQLDDIQHPVFRDAEVDPDVTWKLTCGNCGTEHKFGTDTTELDRCCDEPIHGEIDKYENK